MRASDGLFGITALHELPMKGQTVTDRIKQFLAKHGVNVSFSPTITLCGILSFSLGTGVSLLPEKWSAEDRENIADLVNAVVKISFEEFKQNLLTEIGQAEEDVAAIFKKARAEAGEPMQQVIQLLSEEPVLTVRQFKRRTEIVKLLQYKFIGRIAEFKNFNYFLDVTCEKIGVLIDHGGAGKTRLSVELAERLEEEDDWNVYFVHPKHKFIPFNILGKTLLILDEASRYNYSDDLIDFVLNPPLGSGTFKLLVIDRPIFQESFESYLSEIGEHATPIKIGKADITAFLEANYEGIGNDASEKIAQKSGNSFVYAAQFAEYYQKKHSVPELATVISESIQKYIKDIAIETSKPTRYVKQAIEMFSLIQPIDWNRDWPFIKKGLSIDQFQALEAVFTTCIESDLVLLSDGVCTINPDPISDCVRLGVINNRRWSAIFNKLHMLFPFRVAYNIAALPRLDPSIVDKVGKALHHIWIRLNDTAERDISPEYFFATDFFTRRFAQLPFCDVAEANRQVWISRYIACKKQYPEEDFRQPFINSLAYVTAAYNRPEQSDTLKKRVEELEGFYRKYNCRELQIAFARELVNATRFFVRTDNLRETLRYQARLRELHHPPDLKIAEWLARGIVNSIEILGKVGKTIELESCLTELRGLSEVYPDELVSFVVSGVMNALTSYAILRLPDKMDDCLRDLERLQPPIEVQKIKPPDVDLIVPSSAFFSRVIRADGTKDDCLNKLAYYGQPGQQAIVASTAAIGCAVVGKLDKMEHYLQEFKRLINVLGSENCKNNIAVASYYAIVQYAAKNNFEKTEEHFQAISDIYQYPDPEVAIWLARSSLKIAAEYGGVGSFVEMEIHLDKLRSLSKDYPHTEISSIFAAGLLNSSFFYGEFWSLITMEHRLQELKQKYTEDPSIVKGRYFAKCLRNTITTYLKIGDCRLAEGHLENIRSLYQHHHDIEILKSLALALFNTIPIRTLMKRSSYSDLTLLYEARFALSDGQDGSQRINYVALLFALEAISWLYSTMKNGCNLVEAAVKAMANPKTSTYAIQMWFAYLLHLNILTYPYTQVLSANVNFAYGFYKVNERTLDQEFRAS
jgi:hypothetical protein